MVASFLADVDEANVLVHVEGVRKFGTADKVTEHDLIHIGSCTKAMTAVMIASLVSDSPALVGKLSFFPWLAIIIMINCSYRLEYNAK